MEIHGKWCVQLVISMGNLRRINYELYELCPVLESEKFLLSIVSYGDCEEKAFL
ncbi:hypothetical protein [Faecalicatena faecalis]|uniref:hypothetical protein n=1 Tax=Faecalicatena faecalis TaxID=2726362 RepID=UPI001C0A9E48|nr:hypothetical protein [Faecalicatena faecalis]